MLRFLHSSDWHLTAGTFFDETLRVLEYIAEVGEREKVNRYLLAGDFTHSDLPHRVQTPTERNALAEVFERMAMGVVDRGSVALTYGNHDLVGDLRMFGCMDAVMVFADARIVPLLGCDLLAVPYPHKRHWLAQRVAGAVEAQRQELGHTLSQALRALAQQRRPGVPLIGLAHLNIAGSKLGGGEVLIGQEIELTPSDLDEIGCDYWALGHIHNPQQVSVRGWYAGTPQPHSFGDSNVNGFNLVEIEEAGLPPRVTFIETPATKLHTWHVGWAPEEVGGWLDLESENGPGEQPVGGILRIVAHVAEADRETADWDWLEKLRADHDPRSKIERRVIPTTRVRSERIRSAHTPAEKLRAFWETLEPAPPEEDRAAALEALDELADGA